MSQMKINIKRACSISSQLKLQSYKKGWHHVYLTSYHEDSLKGVYFWVGV